MVTVPSTMLPLGSPVPAFALPDVVSGRTVRHEDFAGRPLLVMFICNHCPYVVHIRKALLDTVARLRRHAAPGGRDQREQHQDPSAGWTDEHEAARDPGGVAVPVPVR